MNYEKEEGQFALSRISLTYRVDCDQLRVYLVGIEDTFYFPT